MKKNEASFIFVYLSFVPRANAQSYSTPSMHKHMLFMITRLSTSSNDGVFDHSDPRGFPL